MIELGDLIVVVFPNEDWTWQRYKIGDIGLVLRIIHYKDYSVAQVRLIRTEKTESIPLDYIIKLGWNNGSRGSGADI
tara:strand:+ start:2494 stop:2724 length:231 start_codon:yes stop_codon:yes gene_type:complete